MCPPWPGRTHRCAPTKNAVWDWGRGHKPYPLGRIMAQAIKIRQAETGELDEIENLVKTAYSEFQPLMPLAAWDRWMDNIRETIQAPDGVLLVAGDQGRIGGPSSFTPMPARPTRGSGRAGRG